VGPLNHDSPAAIRAVLERRGLGLKKRWGQNFLVNRGVRERIVGLLSAPAGGLAWEIGPGLGSMTGLLLDRGARVVAFEVDHGIARFLREEELAGREGFTLVEGDFLRTWREALAAHGVPAVVLGNLPYRSASLMIADLVTGGLRPARAVFTVQRELAERLTAAPGAKSYSSFTVLCGTCFSIEGRGDLKPGSFWPAPEVVSSIVEMRLPMPLGRPRELTGDALVAARRKTIRNIAGGIGPAEAGAGGGPRGRAGARPNVRGDRQMIAASPRRHRPVELLDTAASRGSLRRERHMEAGSPAIIFASAA
jgi:16S rRNA (adenine1518-N6/adenine1519-N6)-dimethyltransferase